MKIIRVAKPGKIMNQPHGKNPSGKLDSQIFLEKEDPFKTTDKSKKKKKEKCTTCTAKKSKKESEDFDYNPWAVCTESVGREDEEKYESCVKQVKKKEKK